MRPSRGFTLIELMVTISVLAIFVSIALPSFNNLVETNRLKSAASEFHALLVAARSDAVTSRATVNVIKNQSTWSTGARQVTIPASVTVSQDQTTITFKPNGTATESTTKFTDGNGASYTIQTKPAGLIKNTQG